MVTRLGFGVFAHQFSFIFFPVCSRREGGEREKGEEASSQEEQNEGKGLFLFSFLASHYSSCCVVNGSGENIVLH